MNIISSKDISKEFIENIFKRASEFEERTKVETRLIASEQNDIAKGKILATIFYEPSTRTRMSFESAMIRLGGNVISASDMKNISSSKKGESLKDSAKVISNYCDVIAIRHNEKGAVEEFSKGSKVPVISAGDGANEHPTQALLDFYTIEKEKGTIDGLKIVLVGDLKYGRTVHSLSKLLKHYNVELYLVSPELLKMPEEIMSELAGLKIHTTENLSEVISEVDVLYMTRVQKERFENPFDYEKCKDAYIIDNEILKSAKKEMIIMHPLPRVNEIKEEVDLDSRAKYFKQAENAVYVRMAILEEVITNDGLRITN